MAASGTRADKVRPTEPLVDIRDQHNVAIQVPAGDRQLLAVVGPVEFPNQFALEVSDLPRWTSGKRLLPDVAHAPTCQYVVKSTPVTRPAEYLHPRRSLEGMKHFPALREYD